MDRILDHLLALYRDLFILVTTGGSSTLSYTERVDALRALVSGMELEDIENGIAAIEEARRTSRVTPTCSWPSSYLSSDSD